MTTKKARVALIAAGVDPDTEGADLDSVNVGDGTVARGARNVADKPLAPDTAERAPWTEADRNLIY